MADRVFMELPGAVRALELMTFTRNARHGDSHHHQGNPFHYALHTCA